MDDARAAVRPTRTALRAGRARAVVIAVLIVGLTAVGCTVAPPPRLPSGAATPVPSTSPAPSGLWDVSGTPEVLARGLDAPWSVVPLSSGGASSLNGTTPRSSS